MSRFLSFRRAGPLLAALACAAAGVAGAARPAVAAADGIWKDVHHVAGELPDPLVRRAEWERHDICVYRSMLSPGTLIRMKSPRIRFFGGLSAYGAEGPSFLIANTVEGVVAFPTNRVLTGDRMRASWLVASFQGAAGWEDFDAPWFLAFEKRPDTVTLGTNGLEIAFSRGDTGLIFSMPLYGWHKLPQEKKDFCAEHGLPRSGVEPWKWKTSVPTGVIARCELWARIAKAYPVGFQESFSVNPGTDEIAMRYDYRWLTIEDDWNTAPLRFATLSPCVGLAWKTPGFPMSFSAKIRDPEYATGFGPYVGAFDTDRLELKMRVMQYVNELERLDKPPDPTDAQRQALLWMTEGMKRFSEDWRHVFDHGSRDNFCWNIVADVWYAKALPFLDEPLRTIARKSLRIYFDNDVLTERAYRPFRGKLILVGPGIATWGGWDDAGKFASNALQAIWAYGQYAGDWDLIRERWDIVRRLFITPEEMNWVFFGRAGIAEMGDEAPPCSAFARMGWAVGDADAYLFGCYAYARELIHHYVKQNGARYFYERQPLYDLKPMDSHVYLTDVWGDTVGWQLDGPVWGRAFCADHQSANRWVRFHDPDTGRFYRDHLAAAVRDELAWYQKAGLEKRPDVYAVRFFCDEMPGPDGKRIQGWFRSDQAHGMTGLARIRSFALGESYAELSRTVAMSDYAAGTFGPGRIATAYAYLRAIGPVRHDRLVPPSVSPSPYVLGLQRRGLEDHTGVAQSLWDTDADRMPRWWGWPMPKAPGAGRPPSRCFGSIRGAFDGRVEERRGGEWISYGCHVSWADMQLKTSANGSEKAPGVRGKEKAG